MWELVPKYCTIARLRAKSHSVARKINSMRSVFSEVYYLRWFIVQWPVAKTGTTTEKSCHILHFLQTRGSVNG